MLLPIIYRSHMSSISPVYHKKIMVFRIFRAILEPRAIFSTNFAILSYITNLKFPFGKNLYHFTSIIHLHTIINYQSKIYSYILSDFKLCIIIRFFIKIYKLYISLYISIYILFDIIYLILFT